MMHSPESLVGDYATVSDWIAELLMVSLQWPGFEASHLVHKDIASIHDLKTFSNVLEERLKKIDKLICTSIDIPSLITTIRRPKNWNHSGFRLVTVQPLLPKFDDFSFADPALNSSRLRPQNRDHLA